jgi:hypothetical protein
MSLFEKAIDFIFLYSLTLEVLFLSEKKRQIGAVATDVAAGRSVRKTYENDVAGCLPTALMVRVRSTPRD